MTTLNLAICGYVLLAVVVYALIGGYVAALVRFRFRGSTSADSICVAALWPLMVAIAVVVSAVLVVTFPGVIVFRYLSSTNKELK